MVAKRGFASPNKDYLYPYPVYFRSPISGVIKTSLVTGKRRYRTMGLTTVIRDYGTEILNAIRENDLHKLRMILEKTLRSDAKIAKLCVTDIKHKPTKKFACPLILAARQEDPRIMKYMMEKGTDPNFVHHTIFSSKRREIVTALHLAVDLGHYDTAEVLLNANADANIYDHNKETPLHIAVKKADHTMMKLLLSKGADPLIPDNKNNAALHIATLYGHLQMVRTLLKYDADVYQKGQWETVPPHIAAKEGHTHLIQLFSAKDLAIINVKIPCYLDRREKAPIHLAAENGHAECLSVLLEEFDANVNLKDSDGNTALHSVVLHPYDAHRMRDKEYFTQSARLLLKFRVSINEKNIFGDTALHFAAMNHYHRIVELLLDNGANPFLENEDGMKPIDTVPESDPVTKQILKMAMTKGRPPISISSAQRRAVDGSINNTTLQDSALDQSRSNISYRSVSSTSSVFIDDTKPVRSHRSREADGRHSRSKSKTKLPEVEETPRAETELTQQQQGVPQKIENEIAVYSKVNKKQRPKQRASQGRAMDLGYDQQEWEVISTTTMNEESVQGSIISQHETNKTTSKTSGSRQSQQQQTCVGELADIEKQQEYIEKKNRINKHQKHRSEQDDIGLDIAVPQHEEEVPPARVGKKGEVIYENITPLTAEEAPPLPPRKNRPSTSVDDQQQPGLEQRQCIEDGVKVHKVVGHPSAIEVQYEGGPIMISVETSNDPGEKKHSRASKHKIYSTPSPKQHRKQSASPKIKRKCEHDIPSGHTYDDEQMEEPVSPVHKHADHKELGTSESYTSAQEYYRDYYDEKAIKKKKRSKVAKTAGQTSSDPVGNLEQSVDNYFNGTYDISELESFQQSMMSESSQPELVKKIIEQKICELLEQKARKGKKSQKSDDKLKQWLMETDENDEDTEDTEDEDKEHILDSDEWSDDEEFQTPSKWLETEEGYEDENYAQEVEQKRMPTKSTPLKQQPVAGHKKPKTQQKEVVTVEKDQSRLKEYKPEIVETPPKSVKQSPVKSLPKINIVKESSEVIMPNEQREHDEEGNEVSVKSPGQMTFKEKLAWAKAQEKKQAELGTTVKNLEAETDNMLTKATTAAGEQGRQKSKAASEGSDQSVKVQEHQNEYYSLAHDIECSTSSTSTDVSTTITTDTRKASQFTEKEKSTPEKEQAMEVEEYEGSPFSRRRNAKYIQSHADAEAEDTASVTTRLRSKSQNDILDVDDRERSVSPVTLKDIPKHGLRTSSVVSEGTGLGLRVSGQVPKAYSHADKSSARKAFMLANPVKIESSSECSDTELHGSRSSVSEGSGHKDRGKLWEESMQKPVYPKHSSGLTSATSTSDTEISKQSSNGTTVKTGTKIIGGYTKPYKSFGKIEVNTDLIEEAMLNASIPEDPETASDLEPFEVSDIEREVDHEPIPHVEVNIEKTKGFHVEELDQEPGFARFARQRGGEEKETSQQVPPLPLNSPPAVKPEEPQLSPRSDTSSVSGRKVVSVKENLRSESGDIIEVITTTVIKQEVPHAEVAVTETVAPTDDLSFGDSTGDDLDELVLQNMQIKTPSELPPPPPELMNTDDSQELLNPLTDKTNKINMHDEQIGENEQVQQTKTGNLKKKSKSKKSTENLADAGELEPKKKKKKKKKAKPAEQDNKNAQKHIQVEESLKEDTSLEMYDQEPGVIKPKKVKGIPTVLALGKEGIQQKPSEMAELQYTERQVETEQHKSRPDKEMDVAGVQVLQQTDEQGQTSDSVKQKLPTDVNQSMTDMEVAQITDAAEARRKAREAARAQRLWHKKMIEEGKDPSIFLKSRSHSRETSDEQRKASPSPTRNVKPDSYNIVIEGQAEVATSEGKRMIVSSENVQQKHDGADDSVLGKQSKKKKTKKLCSTDDLVSEKKKKKKKKKTVSEDEVVLVGASGGVDELAPKGTVQGVPPETVISDIWKEAMEGQPLASSETVYKEKPLNSSSEVRSSRRGRKLKGTTTENIAQHANVVDEDMSEASLQGLIKPATVPLIDNTEQYDSISDDEFEQDSENVLSVELTPAEKEQIIAKKEAKKKQQKLIRLGKKYKLEDGNTVNDELQKQQQKQQDSELITLDRSPGATRQKQQKSRVQHAVLLRQTEDKSPEGTFEEPLPDKFVQAATVQQVKPAVQSSYETNLDEESPVSDLDEEIPVAAMNLTEEQKRAIMKAREAKKQRQVHKKPVSPEAHAFREGSLPLSDQQHITDQRQQSGHTHGVQLQQKIDDFIPEGDELPQDFIKRAAIPDFGTGQRAAYETNLDDSDEQKNSETGQAITNVQQTELNKAKEVRRLQQSLDKIAKHREKEKSMEPQQKISAQELKINQEISDNSRPKHAVQLRQQQEYPHDDDDDGSSLSENIIRRVDVPAGSVVQKFEISQEDSDDEVHNQSQTDVITVSLSKEQREAKARAMEEKKQAKARERRERKNKQQNIHSEEAQPGEPATDRPVYETNLDSPAELVKETLQNVQEKRQELDEEGYLLPQPSREQHRKPHQSHSAVKLKQPYQDEDEYLEISEPMPDYVIQKVQPPSLPPRPSYDAELDDLHPEQTDMSELLITGKKSQDKFKNAAFAAFKKMQGQDQKTKDGQEPEADDRSPESGEAFTRSASGRIRVKRAARPNISQQNKEVFIDREPELMGEDALPPDGNTDAQLQQELARLRGAGQSSTPLMSELWQEKKEQESEMKLMLQSVQDPAELEPNKSRLGGLPPPPTEPLPTEVGGEKPTGIRDLDKSGQQQSPSGSMHKPPKAPVKVDRRPPPGLHTSDSPHLSQSGLGESPHSSTEGFGRPRSQSEGKQYEPRARTGSEGKSPRHMQPVKRRIRRAYPSDGELYAGHQSDSEAIRKARRVKSISFYGDFRRGAAEKRDKPPKMTASQSLEEAAWKAMRQDLENQPQLRPHRVIKRHSEKTLNYTRGIYRPVPVYWRGSQRSFANTSRYDDSELIDQLWNERHRSMTTESEGDADMEDASYDVNMPEHGTHESDQFGSDQQASLTPYSHSMSDDEHSHLPQYSSAPQLPPSELQHGQYFGAFQPVGPPKKVTIVDKKHRTRHQNERKDLPPRIIDPRPVDFKNYGAAAKLWMEQVDRTQTQKSKTMYLSMMGDQQPPPEIIQDLVEDEQAEASQGSQWVIARGRSLRRAKQYYDQQRQMEGDIDQENLDPGKQMLLFFKIGENWKDLAWVLFDGLQSEGDTLRMLKEIQHRHPDKINDQVHDMMHRWWKKKGSAATIEELQRGLEVLKMAYVEEEYVNPHGVFSEAETELDASTASEEDAEVNRLIHDYKTRSLNASFENKTAQNAAVQLKTPESNSALNTDNLLRKLEEAAVEHKPAKINRSSITRASPPPPSKPKHEDSHGESDFEGSADGTHRHSFVIIQPQLDSKEYKHETNM